MKSTKEFATRLAADGYRVFPLLPGEKRPAIDRWPTRATTDSGTVADWWGGQSATCNIGIATGKGLLVVDADCKANRPGLASLEMLDMLGLPASMRVRTPSGGVHVYLRVPTDIHITIGAECLAQYPGIDIRCEGGYVVGPGSTVGGERYEII